MSNVFNWQLGREMEYPVRRGVSRPAVRVRLQHQPLHRLPELHHGLQVHLDLLQRPGIHVVEQRRDQTLRRLSASLGREDARPAGAGQSRRPELGRHAAGLESALRPVQRQDDFRSGARTSAPEGAQTALGYLPTDEEWAAPNRYEDHPDRHGERREGPDDFNGGELLPQHKTWFFYLARICNHCSYPACLAACPRNAIYKRPEDGIVLVDQERCRGYRKCMEACPYKKTFYRGTTRTTRKMHRLLPARRRPRPGGRRPADANPLHGRVRRPHPAAGPGAD